MAECFIDTMIASASNPKYTFVASNYYDGSVVLDGASNYMATAAFLDLSGPYFSTHVVTINKGVLSTVSGGGIFSGGTTLAITKPFNSNGGYIVLKVE